MARLEDLPIYEQEHLLSKLLPPLGKLEWVKHEKNISEMKFAIITTAGLTYKDGDNFNFIDASYRAIPKDCLLYTSPSPRDAHESRMPSSA